MFRSPSTLDVESLLCEQGNRQRHALAYASGQATDGTKAQWEPKGSRKDLTKVTLSYRGADGCIVLEKGVNLLA